MTEFVLVYDSIFNRKTHAIVNPVNCMGVMGAGLALKFKRRYPDMFKHYLRKCETNEMRIGNVVWYSMEQHFIAMLATKLDWQQPSTLGYIRSGLASLAENPYGLRSISVPPLGCGLGGLSIRDIKPLIREYLTTYQRVELVLYPTSD
jgi:O-acetyl-ADP-ribose deacetylase (regulator of RNase III)